MPGFNDRFLEGLDAAAERTGVPGLVTRLPRRRHLRWLPVVALSFASAGIGLGLVRVDLLSWGYALVMIGFALSVILPLIGPVKPWGGPDKVDEFDRAMRSRAFLVTFASISVAAVLGMWLVVGLSLLSAWPREVLIGQICALSLYLFTLYSAVPTLYSSWATRPVGEDD